MMTFPSDPRKRADGRQGRRRSSRPRSIDPEGYTLYTYAAIQIWAEAAKKAGTTDPKKVAEALQGRPGLEHACWAPITFDKKGDVTVAGLRLLRLEERQLRRDVSCG